MEINLDNYEGFFLDYKEGNLSAMQEKELFLFLERYPYLHEELDAFENIVLEDSICEGSFVNKNAFKKTDPANSDLIAYTEGLLNEQSKKNIDDLASQNVALKKELDLYVSAKIQPDLNEKFKNKTKLKRGGLVIALQNNYAFLRVAAALLLLIGLFFLMTRLLTKDETGKNKLEIANVNRKAKDTVQNESRNEKQEQESQRQAESSKNLASADDRNSFENLMRKQKKEEKASHGKIKSFDNSVQTNSVVTNDLIKNTLKDTAAEKIILVQNNIKKEEQKINNSYYNHVADKEDDETPFVTSVSKKSFFQKLVKVAKKVNDLGVKNVEAAEETDSNSLSIGSFVVEETISTRPVNKN